MASVGNGRLAIVIVLLFVAYFVYRILTPFLPGLVWAIVLATIFHPAYRRIARRVKRPRLASALTCVLLGLLIVLPALVLLWQLAGESVGAYRVIHEKIEHSGGGPILEIPRHTAAYQWLIASLHKLGMPEPDLGGIVVRGVRAVSEFLVAHSPSVVSGLAGLLLNLFIMLAALYYLFLKGATMLSELRVLSPLRREDEERIFERFRGIALSAFGGMLATAAIEGLAGGVMFWLFGLPSPLLWGAGMAVLAMVPLLGTPIIWGPVGVYFLLTGAAGKGLLLLTLFSIIIGVVDNIMKPLMMRRGAEINSLLIFMSVLGGVGVFGLLGFVLGPFFVAILFVLIDIYKAEVQRGLAETTMP